MSVLRKVETFLDRFWIRILFGSHGVTVLPEEFLITSCASHHNIPASVELGFLHRVLGSLLHLGLRPWPGHQREALVGREFAVRRLSGLGNPEG